MHPFFNQNEVEFGQGLSNKENEENAQLPDITNLFQPNILKRKRLNNSQMNQSKN